MLNSIVILSACLTEYFQKNKRHKQLLTFTIMQSVYRDFLVVLVVLTEKLRLVLLQLISLL